jgi:hypothetical protein
VQYLNNILEQDHRAIKRRVNAKQGFREFQAARRTIQGYEAVHMIPEGASSMGSRRGSSSADSVHRQSFRFGSLRTHYRQSQTNLSAFETCNTTFLRIITYFEPVRFHKNPVNVEWRAAADRPSRAECTKACTVTGSQQMWNDVLIAAMPIRAAAKMDKKTSELITVEFIVFAALFLAQGAALIAARLPCRYPDQAFRLRFDWAAVQAWLQRRTATLHVAEIDFTPDNDHDGAEHHEDKIDYERANRRPELCTSSDYAFICTREH